MWDQISGITHGGGPVSPDSEPPTVPNPSAAVLSGNDFAGLRILAGVHKVASVLSLFASVVGLILVAYSHSPTVPVVIALAVGAVFAPLFLWAGGELLLVLVSIERNTRSTARILAERGRARQRTGADNAPDGRTA